MLIYSTLYILPRYTTKYIALQVHCQYYIAHITRFPFDLIMQTI